MARRAAPRAGTFRRHRSSVSALGNINFILDYLYFACKRVELGGSTGLDLCPLTANATDVAAKGQ
jgi:hypothetical protein